MKEEFEKYLCDIGITSRVLFSRVNDIYDFYSELLTEEIQDIYVSEYIEEDGTRVNENLWLFTDNYCMEAKQFVSTDDFDLYVNKKRIHSWVIKKVEYDFKNINSASRLSITFRLLNSGFGELKASQENCNSLRDIFKKCIMPNLVA